MSVLNPNALIEFTLESQYLSNSRSIWVLPPVDATNASDLVMFLDGEFYLERVGARTIVQELRSQSSIRDGWFVFVSHHSLDARWTECPCNERFAQFVVEECLIVLKEKLGISVDSLRKTLIGLSYTGLAAAFIAFKYPVLFDSILAQSGSFWSKDEWLTRQLAKSTIPSHTTFWLDVGNLETATEVAHRPDVIQIISQIEGVQNFRGTLVDRGFQVEYKEFDGGHDMKAWARILPVELKEILPN